MPQLNPTLAYFAEEDGKIYLCVKTDSTGYLRFEISPLKAIDMAAELARMAAFSLRQQRKTT